MIITGEPKTNTIPYADFGKYENQEITITGTVHNIRMMSVSRLSSCARRGRRYNASMPRLFPITACPRNLKRNVR